MTLLDKLSDEKQLTDAWYHLNKNNLNSHGISGVTISDFGNNLTTNIDKLVHNIKNRVFKFSDVRGASIAKKNSNKKRPLRISEIQDRIVAKAITKILEEELYKNYPKIYENNTSFAYIEKKGIKDAWQEIVSSYKNDFKYILEVDIKNFFGTIDIKKLLNEKVFPFLSDNTLNSLIEDALSQNVGNLDIMLEDEKELFQDNGLPQGNSLSPFLSNIYLYDFDRRFENEVDMKLVRYADDFVILCKSKKMVQKALSITKHELQEKLGLKIYDVGEKNDKGKEKTKIIENINFQNLIFLSIRFDGKRLIPIEDKREDITRKIEELIAIKKDSNILETFNKINNYLCGWLASYHFCNIDIFFEKIDKSVNKLLARFLYNINWELKNTNIEKKQGNKNVHSLTEKQREASGILTCKKFFEQKMKDIKVII